MMEIERPIQHGAKEHAVMLLLNVLGDMYGLDLVEKSRGALARSSIYVLLSRLERKGFVTSYYVDTPAGEQGPRRRLYRLTDDGRNELRCWDAAAKTRATTETLYQRK